MEQILTIDGKILLFIQNFLRFEWLTEWMILITKLGDGGVIWIFITALLLCSKKYRKAGICTAVALLLGYLVTNLLLKNMLFRVRPYAAVEGLQSLIGMVHGSSFPSGHTTSSMAAGAALFLKVRGFFGTFALVLAVAISFSRLYVGVHYPTDVLSGAVIGVCCALCARKIVQ